jgi:hypothetical protein
MAVEGGGRGDINALSGRKSLTITARRVSE